MENPVPEGRMRFCEMTRDAYCSVLETYQMHFEHNDFILTLAEPKKVFHILADGGYLLQTLKIHRALSDWWTTLYVAPDDGADLLQLMIEVFGLPQYTHLIIVGPNFARQSAIGDVASKLRQTLRRFGNKTVVIIAEETDSLVRQLRQDHNIFRTVEWSVAFEDLTKESRERLWSKRNIIFQGVRTSLRELLASETSEGYEATLKREVLERLVGNEAIRVGSKVQGAVEPPGSCYVSRVLRSGYEEVDEVNIANRQEKVTLITGGAGSGKSALLARLAMTIKNEHPQWWVIAISLQDYTRTLMQFQRTGNNTIMLEELLDSRVETKLATPFEEFIFRKSKKVVLMLDGVDQAWPDYAQLILNLVGECRDAPHISRVILTSRPDVIKQLEEEFRVTAFSLQPFMNQKLTYFLVDNWTHHLQLDNTCKDKCRQYALKLIQKIASHQVVNGHFVGTPLGAKLLAELFKESDPSEKWEGCREFLKTDRAEPNISERAVVRLTECFVQETRNAFMDRANPIGSTMASQALNQLYEESLACHRTLAVSAVLGDDRSALFSDRRQADEYIKTFMFKIGFVQERNNQLSFAYEEVSKYFVADGLLNEFRLANHNAEFQGYFLDKLLIDPNFVAVRAFLDSSLKKRADSLDFYTFTAPAFQKYLSVFSGTNEVNNVKEISMLMTEGCVAILQFFRRCADITHMKKYSKTLLHSTAEVGNFNTANFLVEYGAKVNIRDGAGCTPIHSAVSGGHLDMVKLLVEHGADVNIKNSVGRTPLNDAASGGHWDIVKFLVATEANVNTKDNVGQTALHFAAQVGHLDTVKLLLEEGADVNVMNKYDQMPLDSTIRGGYLDTAKLLVKRGADVNVKDKEGRTALHQAAWESHLDKVKLILEIGAKINVQDKAGESPLHNAASKGHLENVKFLMERGADQNITNSKGWTPLHVAAWEGHLQTVKVLVQRKANKNFDKDKDGWTPQHGAAWAGHLDIVKFLVEQGADVDITNDAGQTPLHYAAWEGHLDIVTFLVQRGAKVNVKNNIGKTALDCAADKNKNKVVDFLKKLR